MRFKLEGWVILAAMLILIAGWLAVRIVTDISPTEIAEAGGAAADIPARIPINRIETSGASRKPSIAQAIGMSPGDWPNYLASHAIEIEPELREELIELAVELEESIAAGLSPQSVEAQVYGEAMLVLIESELPND